MMKQSLFLIFMIFVFIITACSKGDPYEVSMRAGKDALIAEDYEKAISQFELALIESPQDKDAKILLDQAKSNMIKKQTSDMLDDYKADVDSNLSKYKVILDKYKKNSIESLDHQNDFNMSVLNDIKKDIEDVDLKYHEYDGIININSYLIKSIDNLISFFSEGGIFTRTGNERAVTYLKEYEFQIKQVTP